MLKNTGVLVVGRVLIEDEESEDDKAQEEEEEEELKELQMEEEEQYVPTLADAIDDMRADLSQVHASMTCGAAVSSLPRVTRTALLTSAEALTL